jgi:segregation and condensation protein B
MSDTPEHEHGDETAEPKKPAEGEAAPAAEAEGAAQPAETPAEEQAAAAEHEPAAEAAPAAEEAATEELAEPVPAENYGRKLELILEALLLAADGPLPLDQMQKLVASEFNLGRKDLRAALERMGARYADTACELREVAGGWRLQVKAEYGEWVGRLWQEKPPKYSRALLETLALVVYRQPITRGEIEDVRGVAVSTNILRTLLERGWVREVGHKEVPGRPALYGTAPQFLDDFNLKSLDQLPDLPAIKDLEQLEAAMARLGQHADVVASVRAEQEAAENPIQMDVGGEDGEAPVPGDDSIDEPPQDTHTLH